MHEFYDRHEYPTSEKILSTYKEKTGYDKFKTSLWRILRSLDFKYKKCNYDRMFLVERNDTVATRVKFLQNTCNLSQSNDTRPVVYLDETWVNQNRSREHIWRNSRNTESLKTPTGKGGRIIVSCAGSS